jgi:hypothetical protein
MIVIPLVKIIFPLITTFSRLKCLLISFSDMSKQMRHITVNTNGYITFPS